MTTKRKLKALGLGLLCGGVPLVTNVACDPRTGAFTFFRDDNDYDIVDVWDGGFFYDDGYYYDDYYYDDYYYGDCFFPDCF